jgi:hypothetical protein
VIELAVIVALATLAVGAALVFALRLLPTVRLQLAGLALLGVTLPLEFGQLLFELEPIPGRPLV